MGKGQNLGELELTVLLALAGGGQPLSSREVYENIVEATGRELAVASVHVTLTRLEGKGLVDASMQEGRPGVGREVTHFAPSSAGHAALRDSRTYWERLWQAVDRGEQ
jgi:DNA-binding PadR family transcriptional regulator